MENNRHFIDGIGFVFSRRDGLSGVDFDNCRNPKTRHIREEYQFWIDKLGGYAEVSPSGTGIKVWVKGTIANRYFKTEKSTGFRILKFAGGEIEVYRRGQYFTVTTQCLKKVGSIASAQRELDVLSEWSLSEVSRDILYGWSSVPEPTEKDAERELSLVGNYGEIVENIEEANMQPTSSTHPLRPVDVDSPSTPPSILHLTYPRCSECGQECNPKYELCRTCYEVSPNRETKVEEAVYAYLSKLKVKGFSAYQQNNSEERFRCKIQFGSRNGYADVVLVNQNDSFAAIAECKGARYKGDGVEQLKSYLSATDTRLGVFANTVDPNDWEFYENQRNNQFIPIDRFEFEIGVVKKINKRARLVNEIQELEGQTKSYQIRVESLRDQNTALSRDVKNFEREVDDLKSTCEQLKKENSYMKSQLEKTEAEIDMKTEEHLRLESQIGQLNRTKSELDTEIGKENEQRDKLAFEIPKLKRTKCELEEKVECLKEQLEKLESYQLQTRIKKLMQITRDRQDTCEKLKGEIEQLNLQKSGLKTKVNKLDERKSYVDTIYKQLEIETDRLGKQKSGLETKVRELKQMESDRHSTCKQLEDQINRLNARVFDLRRNILIKHFPIAFFPTIVITIAGTVMGIFSGIVDVLITIVVLFSVIFIPGLVLEKILLTKKGIISWLKNRFSKENE